MKKKMKAAVVVEFGKPLELQEWDIPTPGPGQILVKTEACGVCHTDVHAWHGDWPVKPTPPFIPGHEGIGPVVAVGMGVTIVKVGDRVGVPWLYSACGHCEYCLSAWETVCADAQFGGYTKNGGFAEYILADPNYVAHIPAGLKSTEAAPIICAGITTYKGIKETGARPGQWIAISGIGGLGHLAIQYAKVMGLRVCAIDVDDGKLAHAKRLGADLIVNAKTSDPIAAVKDGTGGGAHGVLITAPSLGAFKQGVGMTRKHGTCVLNGLPPGEFPTPLFDVVANCITIRGSFVGTRKDMAEALAFAAEGGAVGEVIESRAKEFKVGDTVTSNFGWREYFIASPKDLHPVSREHQPLSVYLGALGMTGMTAWSGLNLVDVKEGDVIYISGAAGAVGNVAGQLAKLRGCKVIGSAGSMEKVKFLREDCGFDIAFDYKTGPVMEQLKVEAPDGIDVYFDNVGGEALEAALSMLRVHGRIIACGGISGYNEEKPRPGPSNLFNITTKRLTMRGLIVRDWLDRQGEFEKEVGGYLQSGKLKNKETVVVGLDQAEEAFIGLFKGQNVGKMVVKLA